MRLAPIRPETESIAAFSDDRGVPGTVPSPDQGKHSNSTDRGQKEYGGNGTRWEFGDGVRPHERRPTKRLQERQPDEEHVEAASGTDDSE